MGSSACGVWGRGLWEVTEQTGSLWWHPLAWILDEVRNCIKTPHFPLCCDVDREEGPLVWSVRCCLDFVWLYNSLLPVFYYNNEVSITTDHPSVKKVHTCKYLVFVVPNLHRYPQILPPNHRLCLSLFLLPTLRILELSLLILMPFKFLYPPPKFSLCPSRRM